MRKASIVLFVLSAAILFPACADTGFRELVYWNLYEVGRMNSTISEIRPSPIEKPETYEQYMRDRRADLEEKELPAPLDIEITSE